MSMASSVMIDLTSDHDRTLSPRKRALKKLNLKGECTTQQPGKETSFRQLNNSTSLNSARYTSSSLLTDGLKTVTQPDIVIGKSIYGANPKAYSVQRKSTATGFKEHLQKSVLEKLNTAHQKYNSEYKYILKAHGINVEKENSKAVMKKSESVFNRTYSVKYFGVMDNHLGVITHRMPLKQPMKAKDPTKTSSPNSSRSLKNFFYDVQVTATESDLSSKKKTDSIIPPIATWNTIEHMQSLLKEENSIEEALYQTLDKEYKGGHSERAGYIYEEQSNPQSQRIETSPNSGTEDAQFKLIPLHKKGPIRLGTDIDDPANQRLDTNPMSERQSGLTDRTYRGSVGRKDIVGIENVLSIPTNMGAYLPRKIKSVKRLRLKSKVNSSNTAVHFSNQSIQKALKTEESDRETCQLSELPQPVRTRIAVVNDEPKRKKEYKDELSIPEKFRSHEVKTITSSRASYSYSKLLKTLYSKENPEEALLENTKKLYEINIQRDQLKQAYLRNSVKKQRGSVTDRKQSPSPQGHSKEEGTSSVLTVKESFCIKMTEPAVNPLYNTFSKIKQKAHVYSNQTYQI